MSNIPKVDRAEDNAVMEIKVRLTERDYYLLRGLAVANHTYMASIARKAIRKHLMEVGA
jgi:hypothetical protein